MNLPTGRIKTIAVEVQWDGAPPVPQRLRQFGRLFASIERDYMTLESGGPVDEHSLTEEGVRFEWHKPRMDPIELARLLGKEHPVRVRSAGITWYRVDWEDLPAGYDAWETLNTATWIRSRELGPTDATGRLR